MPVDTHEKQRFRSKVEWEALVAALGLCAFHLAAPTVLKARRHRWEARGGSFAAGLAAAYVFLQLVPELTEIDLASGVEVHFLVLVGFALLYGIETKLAAGKERGTPTIHEFALRLSVGVIYNTLLIYTIAEQLPDEVAASIIYVLGLGLHLVVMDNGLEERFEARFRTVGRFALCLALLLGWSLASLTDLGEGLVDPLTALLVGFFLFHILHDELPDARQAQLGAFFLGISLFAGLHLAAHPLWASA